MHVSTSFQVLKGTPRKGLLFKKSNGREIEGCADSDWAKSIEDTKSTVGYCTKFGEVLLPEGAKKEL